MNQTRRNFFKTVAATVVAAVVAPAVVKARSGGRTANAVIYDEFAGKPFTYKGTPFFYKDRLVLSGPSEGDCYDFKPFPTEADRLKYRADRGL